MMRSALESNPANALLINRAAAAQQSLGHWNEALALTRRAQILDPRSVSISSRIATTALWLRNYPEAKEGADRAIALAPTNLSSLQNSAMIALGRGDLPAARAIIAESPAGIDQDALVSYMTEYWDLYWVLTDAQQTRVLHLSPAAFDNDRSAWGIGLAEIYALRGDAVRSRAYADSAATSLEQQLKVAPQDPQRHVVLGLALAYLGRSADAIREGERGVALDPVSQDATNGPYNLHQLMRIYLLTGQTDKALDTLEQLLKMPYYLSPGWIRIDPTFAPLKGNPRFERLANGSA